MTACELALLCARACRPAHRNASPSQFLWRNCGFRRAGEERRGDQCGATRHGQRERSGRRWSFGCRRTGHTRQPASVRERPASRCLCGMSLRRFSVWNVGYCLTRVPVGRKSRRELLHEHSVLCELPRTELGLHLLLRWVASHSSGEPDRVHVLRRRRTDNTASNEGVRAHIVDRATWLSLSVHAAHCASSASYSAACACRNAPNASAVFHRSIVT